MDEALEAWNKIRIANGNKAVKSLSFDQVDMSVSFREITINSNKVYLPLFKFE
jgi:hypothetical protein